MFSRLLVILFWKFQLFVIYFWKRKTRDVKWKPKSSFHIEDFESLLWANEGEPIREMIVSSPISDKNFDDSKSSMWKEL